MQLSLHINLPVRDCPEEGCKNDSRDGTTSLQGQAERTGAGQPGEEKAPGRPESHLSAFNMGL